MARIVLASGIQVSTNPRVAKEADTLAAAGHEVTVLAGRFEARLREREATFDQRPWHYLRLADGTASGLRQRADWAWLRLRRRLAVEALVRGVETPGALGYLTHRILRTARQIPADLYVMHNPLSLWAGQKLLREGHRVAFDIEDWYSEDGLPEDRAQQPIRLLRRLERVALREGAYVTTTSESLSGALAEIYDAPAPAVVHNTFPWAERDGLDGEVRDRRDRSLPSVTWFSQTIGPGRGLEVLAEAIRQTERPFELHLRGTLVPGYDRALLERMPETCRERVFFHPQVSHEELLSRIAEHDIGLAAEIPFCRSRALTITNKILQYLLAGVAVVASDTPGQREVAHAVPEGVLLYEAKSPASLAASLDTLLADPDRLARAKAAALEAARMQFSWERTAPRLLTCVEEALSAPVLQ